MNAKKFPDKPALMTRKDNNWSVVTYEDYYHNCMDFAKCIHEWFGTGTKVAIIGYNSPAWYYAHIGTMYNYGVPIGISESYSGEICNSILNHSEAEVLVVENGDQIEKIIGMETPKLKLILYYTPISEDIINKVTIPIISFGVFIENKNELTKKFPKNKYTSAVLIYTSGTTNDPKAILLSHKNIASTAINLLYTLKNNSSIDITMGERFISYLPLNHISSLMTDIYIPICILGTVWFADKNAAKSSIINTIRDARPTIFCGMPNIWEKICNKIESKNNECYLPTILTKNKIVNDIGLNKCKLAITSSATISEKCVNLLEKFGIILYDIYGLSETSGPLTISAPNIYNKGSVGKPIDGIRIKIDNDGEILVKGPGVFTEYYKDIDLSIESFKNGWFKTGDIGYLDKLGYLVITGRKKEIVVLSNGEIIPMIPIEQNLLDLMPEMAHIIVVGDNQKNISILIVPKIKNNKLDQNFLKIDPTVTINNITSNEKIKKYIDNIVNAFNEACHTHNFKINKWTIINTEFTVGQELTSTFKLRRQYINKKYKSFINKLFINKSFAT